MKNKEKLEALRAEAADLRAKAQEGTLDEAGANRAMEVAKEYGETLEAIETAAKTDAEMGALLAKSDNFDAVSGDRKVAQRSGGRETLGSVFVKGDAYTAFKKAHPSGVGRETPISIKERGVGGMIYAGKAGELLTTGGAGNAAPVRISDVEDLVHRPERRLLDVITRGTTALTSFEYRQVIGKTNNAKIVPEATASDDAAALKPLSTLTTTVADAKAYTYADGMEVTNQELSDDGVIQSLIDSTLTENLEIEVEDVLLNGTGLDGQPKGILNTTGILQQDFSVDAPTSIRKALTLLRTTSNAQIRGVLLNPEDDEAWDLLKDTTGRYLGAGPFASGPATSWGYERITSQAIPVGSALLGDFSTIHLLQREALSILAFNQHKDYAQRNLVYIRAELRALQLIRNAAKLAVVDLKGA